MSEWPILEIREFELAFGADGKLALGAVGAAVDRQGQAVAGMPPVRLGIGPSATIPVKLGGAFPELLSHPLADEVFSLRTVDGSPVAPAWYVSIGPNHQELYFIHLLAGLELQGTGLTLNDLELKLMVRRRGGRLVAVKALVSGRARLQTTFLGLGLSEITVVARLEIDLQEAVTLERTMAGPSSLLDGAFKGQIVLEMAAQPLPVGGPLLRITGVDGEWRLMVSSPEGLRSLDVESMDFSYRSARLAVAEVAFALPAVRGVISRSGLIDFEADGRIEFPEPWRLILDQRPTDAAVRLTLRHRPGSTGSTRLTLSLSAARLNAAINPLQLNSGEVVVELVREGGDWTASYRSNLRLTSAALLTRWQQAKLPRLPLLEGVGEVSLGFSVVFAPGFDGGRACVDLRTPGVRRPLGLDLDLDQLRLVLETSFTRTQLSDWRISGDAVVSTVGALRRAIPLTRLQATFLLHGDGAGDPGLELRVDRGLPVLQLPAPGPGLPPLRLFQLNTLKVRMDEGLALEATATLLSGFQPSTLADSLGAPTLAPLLGPLAEALRLVAGRVTLTVQTDGVGEAGRLRAVVRAVPQQPPAFNLLRLLRGLPGAAPRSLSSGQAAAEDGFFQITPRGLAFGATLGGEAEELFFAAEADCVLMGEGFSADLTMSLRPTGPELALMAGVRDPVRISIPYPDLDGLLGSVDLQKLARDYKLSPQAQRALHDGCDAFRRHFRKPESKVAFVFEATDLGLCIRPADTSNPVAVSGSIRLIKAPPEMSEVFGLEGFRVTLGATPESVYFSLGSDGSTPLFSFPTGPQGRAELVVRDLQFSYSWAQNAFAFAWDIDLRANPAIGAATPVGGVFLPGLSSSASFGATATVPPVPIPEFSARFAPLGRPAQSLVDDLGLQIYVGPDSQRLLTLYTQELTFSPTLYLFNPGLRFSGGFLVGGPPLSSSLRLQSLRTQLVNPSVTMRRSFYCFVDVDRATTIAVSPVIGALINPACLAPPFVTATPPFWLVPPTLMADVFFEQLSIALNIPGIVFASLQVSRPLISPNLQQVGEMMALVMSGFSEPLPDDSSLSKLLFIKIQGNLELGLTGESRTRRTPLLDVEVNLVDFINGMIALGRGAKSVVMNGVNLADLLLNDPTALVKLIPLQQRSVALGGGDGLSIGGLRVTGSGSVYLLTPDELEADLKVFHENRREVERGLAAVAKRAPTPSTVLPDAPRDNAWTPRLTARWSKKVFLKPERAFAVDDAVIRKFIDRRAPLLETEARRQRIELAKLRARSAIAVGAVWDRFVAQLPAAAVRVSSSRRALLGRLGFEPEQVALIEREIARLPPFVKADQLKALRSRIVDLLLDETGVVVHEVGRGSSLQATADRLFDQVVGGGVPGPGPLARGMWRVSSGPVRKQRIASVLSSANLRPSLEIEQIFDDEAPNLAKGGAEAETARLIVRQKLLRSLAESNKPKVLSWTAGMPRELPRDHIKDAVLKRLRPDRTLRDAISDLVVLDLERLRSGIGRLPVKTPPTTSPGLVEVIEGFELVARVVPAGQTPFAVPVPGPDVPFAVRQRNGVLQVEIRTSGGAPLLHPLPAWLVAQEKAGPGRAQRLRSRLKIQERRLRRAPTSEETAAVRPIRRENPRLYEEAIVFRPEYRVADSGGRRGPLCLGDFLRRADGTYTLPPGPALLAGVRVAVVSGSTTWFSLQLTGMLAPPGNGLLFGRQDVTLQAGAISVQLSGEFRFLVGDLWANPTGGFVRDALSFNGAIVVKEGGRDRFRAEGEGTISGLGQTPSLSLRFNAALDLGISLDSGDQDLVRITASSRFSGSLDFSTVAGLRLRSGGNVSISVWLLLPPTKRVERCLPFVGCLITEEPQLLDIDEYELKPVGDADAGLSFDVGPQGLRLQLRADLRRVGGLNLGEHTVALDALN